MKWRGKTNERYTTSRWPPGTRLHITPLTRRSLLTERRSSALESDGPNEPPLDALVELRTELADVLWRNDRLPEAREVLHEALALVGPDRPLQAARLYTRLGRVEVESYHNGRSGESDEAAIAAFDAAEELTGVDPSGRGPDWVDVWLEVEVDGRAMLYTWQYKRDLAEAVLSRARPVVEALGSPSRKVGLYVQLANNRASRFKFRVDEATLEMARAAVRAAEQGASQH